MRRRSAGTSSRAGPRSAAGLSPGRRADRRAHHRHPRSRRPAGRQGPGGRHRSPLDARSKPFRRGSESARRRPVSGVWPPGWCPRAAGPSSGDERSERGLSYGRYDGPVTGRPAQIVGRFAVRFRYEEQSLRSLVGVAAPFGPERRALTGVPVSDVLGLPPMAQARLVAGRGGIDRVVRSVNVMEVPDILDWVKPDELLLTTAYPLREDPAALLQLVPRLAAHGLAGMAIKPTRYIGSIPAAMIEDADRLGYPLIELPPPASFNEIIGAVLGVILDIQSVRLQRAAEIHDRFTKIVLGGGGLRPIAEALADSIAMPVAIVDGQGAVLAHSSALDPDLLAVVVATPIETDPSGELAAVRLADGRDAVAQLILVLAERHGTIVAVGRAADLGDDEVEALDYAAPVSSLRLVQARAVAQADRRFQAVCLE